MTDRPFREYITSRVAAGILVTGIGLGLLLELVLRVLEGGPFQLPAAIGTGAVVLGGFWIWVRGENKDG